MNSKCVLTLNEKDARHAAIGLVQGYAGTLADDASVALERIIYAAANVEKDARMIAGM